MRYDICISKLDNTVLTVEKYSVILQRIIVLIGSRYYDQKHGFTFNCF